MGDLFSELMNGFASGGKPAQGGAMDMVSGVLGASGALGGAGKSAGGLSDLMGAVSGAGAAGGAGGLLGGLLGGQTNNPMGALLGPVVNGLAAKLGLPPAIASMATGFLINKMFGGASAPAASAAAGAAAGGGGGFGLDSLLGVMNSGGKGADDLVAKSGMAKEFAAHAKIDDKQAGNALGGLIGMLSGNGMVEKAAPQAPGLSDLGSLTSLFK
jgi:hypothetical protein